MKKATIEATEKSFIKSFFSRFYQKSDSRWGHQGSTTPKPRKRSLKRSVVICSKLTARTTNQETDQILLSIVSLIPHTAQRWLEWPLYEFQIRRFFFQFKIQFKIRNQRPRKPPSSELCENRRISKISCPSYWIRHFDKWKSDIKFVISHPKSPGVQSSTKNVGFSKSYVRHTGSAILNSENPMSNS